MLYLIIIFLLFILFNNNCYLENFYKVGGSLSVGGKMPQGGSGNFPDSRNFPGSGSSRDYFNRYSNPGSFGDYFTGYGYDSLINYIIGPPNIIIPNLEENSNLVIPTYKDYTNINI